MNASCSSEDRSRVWAALRRLRTCLFALTLTVIACGTAPVSTQRPAGVTSVVPWVNSPTTSVSLAGSAGAARPCAAIDLQIVVGKNGAFHGQATQELALHNQSSTACFLSGVPELQLLDPGVPAKVEPGGFGTQRVDLVPTQAAIILIGTNATCLGAGHPKVASTLQMTLPNGDVTIVKGTWINTECGSASVMTFGAVDSGPVGQSQVGVGQLSRLKASITALPSIARGAVLIYRVTLRNTSATSVTLSPCPSYTEVLGTGGSTPIQQTLLLNCAAASAIAGNPSLTYEMRLSVPSSAAAGPTKLSWKLDVAGGTVVGTGIAIT